MVEMRENSVINEKMYILDDDVIDNSIWICLSEIGTREMKDVENYSCLSLNSWACWISWVMCVM